LSFEDYEQSDYLGRPLELYRFALGGTVWRFTSADHTVVMGEESFTPIYIQRGGFTKTGDARKATLEIKTSASNPVALKFRDGWLSWLMILTIYRHHYGDLDFSVFWKGRVTSCRWAGSVATLNSENASTLFSRAGLRRSYQVGCPHALYKAGCNLDASAWAVSATVETVAGGLLSLDGIDAYPDGYFLGGMLKAGEDSRMVVAHSFGSITLVDSISSLEEGATVTLWPGCARTVNACLNKFNNLDNYGGLPYLPVKNPFSGDALI